MPQAVPKSPLLVCLVAQNCLAEAYLRQVLKKEPLIRAMALKEYVRPSLVQQRSAVFVIDQCGLEVPLSECVRHLRTRCLNARFLVLDHEKSTEQIVRLLIMGTQGYVPHSQVARTLVRAIFSLAAGQLWVPPEAFQGFLCEAASALRKDGHGRQTTPREDQILELISRRLSNREIAELLRIRISTVKFHVSNILSKMQARSRRELVEIQSEQLWKMLAS